MTAHHRTDALQAIAYLVRQARSGWKRPDIENALHRIPTTVGLARIAVAALIAAEIAPDNAGPGYINTRGPHWAPYPTRNPTPRELDQRYRKRRREEAEWARAPKPSPQRIKDLRHLSRHGITPTAPEADAWLASNPTPAQPRDTPRPPVLSLQHNSHDNTVTITLAVPEDAADTYQRILRETARQFIEPARFEA